MRESIQRRHDPYKPSMREQANTRREAIDLFSNALRSNGLEPCEIEDNGELHRFSTNGKTSDDSGWYVLHTDGIPAGAFGCWRQGISQTWSAPLPPATTAQEREQHRHRTAQIKRQKDGERERRHAEARERAQKIWAQATPEPGEHRYLRDKGVNAHGVRSDGLRLVIPMRDSAGTLHSLQFIDPNGDKIYLKGGRVKGCYFAIGKPNGVLCIAEGLATGASIHEATGHALAVAFSEGNLSSVAQALRDKYPDLRLVVCADNDIKPDAENIGIEAATKAASAVGGLIAIPELNGQKCDFNDVAQRRGLEAVRACIGDAKPPAKDQDQPTSSAPADDAETFKRLAALSPVEYDRLREREAKCLGVRVSTLDDEVKRLRSQSDSGALNAGHRRGGRHLRCEGDANEVRAFKTFAPVVLAGIGSLPSTLADRSIIIRMERAKPGEIRERFDSRKTAREQTLKRRLIRWSQDNRERIEACEPELPGLYNRRADNWRPLFAIAEVIGGEWLEKVKKAVIALTDKSDESESAGVLLLADIRQIFETAKTDKLASTYLVDRLVEMEERPWPEFRRGKAITAHQVASLLRPFGIISGARREAGSVFRGYVIGQFDSAFSRYLASRCVTGLQPAFQRHSEENSSVTNGTDVTHGKTPKPALHNDCNVVTHRKPGNGTKAWTTPTFEVIPNPPGETPWRERYPPNDTTIDGDLLDVEEF